MLVLILILTVLEPEQHMRSVQHSTVVLYSCLLIPYHTIPYFCFKELLVVLRKKAAERPSMQTLYVRKVK